MKFTVGREALEEAVSWVARALPARPVVPVLGGMLAQADGDGLTLSCFDYEVSARMRIRAEVAEPGTFLVPGRLLVEIVRSLPDYPAEFGDDPDGVLLTCGEASYGLAVVDPGDYPELPVLPAVAGTADGGVLAAAIGQVTPAASRDDTLPMLTAVNLELDGPTMTLAATDRYRLAVRELSWTPAPAFREPAGGQPGSAARPGSDQPGIAHPGGDQPGIAHPGSDQPGIAHPGGDQPGTARPGSDQPGTAHPGGGQPVKMALLVSARTLADAARMMTPGKPVAIRLRTSGDPDGQDVASGGAGGAAGDAVIGFETGTRQLTTRLMAGEYVRYRSRFPEEFGCTADLPAGAFAEAVRRVALVAERGAPVQLSFAPGRVTVEAATPGRARARETVAADFTGDEPAIAFSPHYLLDGVTAATPAASAGVDGRDDKADDQPPPARVRLRFTSASKPAVITPYAAAGAPEYFRYLVVPQRVPR